MSYIWTILESYLIATFLVHNVKDFFPLNLKPELENMEKEFIFRRRQQSIPKVQMKETVCCICKLELLRIMAKGSNLTKPPRGHKCTQPYLTEHFFAYVLLLLPHLFPAISQKR